MLHTKFRIYDSKRKEWVHGPGQEVSLFGECILMGMFLCRPNNEHVTIQELNSMKSLQYTGLNDKDKREIYEGDIILVNGVHRMEIEYSGGAFYAKEVEPYHKTKFGHRYLHEFSRIPGKRTELGFIEMIGNVYDNGKSVEVTE